MPPKIAALVWFIGLVGLFWLDRDTTAKTSKALWIPVIWLSLGTSRMLSQWLTAFGFGGGVQASPDQLLEGSPTDRNLISGLVVVGLIVLISRRRKLIPLLRNNVPFVL